MYNIKLYKNQSKLYIVPTPIGNFQDITQRALIVLQKVQLIAAENIKHTYVLLKHFSIKNNLCSFHKENEKKITFNLIKKILNGINIALVSNAGTPVLNDPGLFLVKTCRLYGITIVPLPGACAAITALSASGLRCNNFIYNGFVPKKKITRISLFKELKEIKNTLIFYESKKRLIKTLFDMKNIFGETRKIVIAKEITKYWELIIDGQLNNIISFIKKNKIFKYGEIVLLLEGYKKKIYISTFILKTFFLLKKELSTKKSIVLTSKICKIKKNILYKYICCNKLF